MNKKYTPILLYLGKKKNDFQNHFNMKIPRDSNFDYWNTKHIGQTLICFDPSWYDFK